MTTSGVLTSYALPAGGVLGSLSVGSDGRCGLSLPDPSFVGRITTSGVVTQYPLPATTNNFYSALAPGPDGALWFTELRDEFFGRVSTGGAVTQYAIPSPARSITTGPDGALWFTFLTEGGDTSLGRMTPTGSFTQYGIHDLNNVTDLVDIATGPDGALWVTDEGGAIGRATITSVPIPTISGPAPPLGNVGVFVFRLPDGFWRHAAYSNWTVSSGSLPPGLALGAASGSIDGTPVSAGTFNFTVTV